MSDLSNWFYSLPIFTRWWMTLTTGFSLLGRFGLLRGIYLALLYEPFIHRFQIWRPVTAVFYYPITASTGFHFLINLYFLYKYSLLLETGIFDGRPADYLFLLLFNWICIVIVALMADINLLMVSMVLSVLYVWCQLNKDVIVSFWFGTRFRATYLPWVLFAFHLIISGGGLNELVGILVGHLYFFLMFKYPQEMGGPSLLTTPSILYRWFPNRQGSVHGFGVPPQSRRPAADPPGGRHNWGRGYVLGEE
ncbi:derlin-1 [Schistocerca cancellata]|uniref:derlin-1 n=1 Tax=Schistocerca cancellata TaxID=274614 RepID=UPI002117652B|nr:derlin-1 [Schistocerca cancellata]